MKPLYTVGMLLVLLAFGGYVYFFEQGPKPIPDFAKDKAVILSFVSKDFQSLELSQKKHRVTLNQVKTDEWEIDSKKADRLKVEAIVNSMKDWKAQSTLMDTLPASQKKDFGLEPPLFKLKLTLASGTKEIMVGAKIPTNTGFYTQVVGDPKLYISYINVPEGLDKLLNETPFAIPALPEPVSQAPSSSPKAK